jgi:hypothetical protein
MAHQPLDDVDVLVPPYEARGIGVAIVITVTLRLAREPSGSLSQLHQVACPGS